MSASLLQAPPLSVYVHLPWCLAKCPYCDFNSHVAPQTLPQAQYIDCLLGDLEFDLPLVAARPIQSVFFGGGTPSLFAPESIARLLTGLRARTVLADDAEVTLEANPGALERGRFAGYRDAGVTRISLGVQSFSDAHLKRLGRIHDAEHVFGAVAELKSVGFDNFNLDLMYGLPEQTVAQAQADLALAIELAPAHLSHYQLALEPGTVFHHRPPTLPDDEVLWEMQVACQAQLATAGFTQYEVSAYARPGKRCRHNLSYWEFGDYIGLGAGAHGKLTESADQKRIWRTVRRKQPREYMSATSSDARLSERGIVARHQLPFEFALNALRLRAGFTLDLFEARTGLTREALRPGFESALQKGLIECDLYDRWFPTDLGWRFLNDLQALFLESADP